MIKKLTPIGNSLGLIIERPILNLLDINRDTELKITTDGRTLMIRPAREDVEYMGDEPVIHAQGDVSAKDAGKSFLDELRDAFK